MTWSHLLCPTHNTKTSKTMQQKVSWKGLLSCWAEQTTKISVCMQCCICWCQQHGSRDPQHGGVLALRTHCALLLD